MLWQVRAESPSRQQINLTVRPKQTNEKTALHFIPRLWPEIGVADLLPVLLGWQAEESWRRLKIDYLHWEHDEQKKLL